VHTLIIVIKIDGLAIIV